MNKRVLIVEDEAVLAKNLAMALQRTGIEAVIASSYSEALRQLDAGRYNLVCADINLGDGNGLELAERISKMDIRVPVVTMTGQDSVPHRMRAEQADSPAFLAKPFALSQFRELVASLISDVQQPEDLNTNRDAGPRVMMYSHDTIGLGHMRRNCAIATELVARYPDISVLLVVGCPGGDIFQLPAGIDVLKLPTVTKMAREKWRPANLRVSGEQLLQIRSGIIKQTVEHFKPDVFVVDHEPEGVWGELRPVFEQIRQADYPTRLVLGLRDILDSPEIIATRWHRSGTRKFISDTYRMILVYGDESVFPSVSAYGLNAMPGVEPRYCGYVSASRARSSPAVQVEKDRPNLLIAGGGGRDAYPMMDAALKAIANIEPSRRPAVTVVAGPLMATELAEDLANRAGELGLQFLGSSNEMRKLIAGADLFVTMAGYNSLVEAVVSGVPTIVVPRIGPSAEQRLRAELFARIGLVTSVSMEGDPVGELQRHFANAQPRPAGKQSHNRTISVEGARHAAQTIGSLLSENLIAQAVRRDKQTTT